MNKINLTEEQLIEKIRETFSDPKVKLLLINDKVNKYWYDINTVSEIPSTGFCYLASEVFYHLSGKAKKWWFKEIIAPGILPNNGYHYFLQHKETGRIIDLTKDQFGDIKIPYEQGKSRGIRWSSKNCNALVKHMCLK